MKRPVVRILTALVVFGTAAPLVAYPLFEHHSDAVAEKLKQAKEKSLKAERDFLTAVELILDKPKREAALQAFKDRKILWEKLSDADAALQSAASPLPETSTTSSLIPYQTEIRYLDLQTQQLEEQAKWIRESWK